LDVFCSQPASMYAFELTELQQVGF